MAREGGARHKHPFLEEIVAVSTSIFVQSNYQESAEFRQFLMSQVVYFYDEVMQVKDSNKDLFEHFAYKYILKDLDSDLKLRILPYIFDTGEFCFVYQCFKNLVGQKPSEVEYFIEEVNKKLNLIKVDSHNKVYSSQQPERAGKSILAVIFLFNYVFTKNPQLTSYQLKKLIGKFHYFINYPDPIGSDANK